MKTQGVQLCREQDKYENFKGDAYAQVAISTNVRFLAHARLWQTSRPVR